MEELIKYKDRLKQVIDFSGLKYGKIYPCDLDAMIEIDNTFLIIVEVKYKGRQMSGGQKLLLARLVNCWNDSVGKKAILLQVEHETPVEEAVQLRSCILTKVYHNKKWTNENNKFTLEKAIEILANKWNIHKLKKSQ